MVSDIKTNRHNMSLDREGNTPRSSKVVNKLDGPLDIGEQTNSSTPNEAKPNGKRRPRRRAKKFHGKNSSPPQNNVFSAAFSISLFRL